jgi:protocatechuate 3,4-dioxygenase beta subunit
VTGVVKAADTGLPIAGALVAMSGASTGSVYTGVDGSYKLVALTPGAVTLTASRAGYQSAGASVAVAPGVLENFSPSLVAVPTEATLSGRIVDGASGAPLAGVAVRIASLNRATLTDASGAFVLAQLPAGMARVDLVLAGYAAQSFSIVIEAGTSIDAQTMRLQKTTPPATTGTIRGTVTAAAGGAPMAGVTIAVQGSARLSALTAADGSYSFSDVAPGTVTLSAVKAGYVAASGSGDLAAGASLIFSPKLTASAVPAVSGRVVDSLTNAPLALARVMLDKDETVADTDGKFAFEGVTSGNHILSLSAPGYLTYTRPLATDGSGSADLQVLKLAKSTAPMTLAGRITDLAKGNGIPNATVAVLDTSLVAKTGADGSYRLEGVIPGSVSLRIGAVGYTSETMIVDVSPYNVQSIDRGLQAGQDSSLALEFGTDRASYSAYAAVAMTARVTNNGATTATATVSLAIFDAEDNYVASFAASQPGQDGEPATRFSFAPGENLVALEWNTGAFAPGRYRAVVRIHQDTDPSDGGPVVLAQRQAVFDIEATAAIGSVRLTPVPAYSHVGADETLAYRLDVVNRSNVPVSTTLNYQLLSPQRTPVDAGMVSLELQPAESSRSQSIQGPAYRFETSGSYPLTLSAAEGAAPAAISGGAIEVAPATRVTPTQNVLPATVVPDGDQRIHVELRLIGVQQK